MVTDLAINQKEAGTRIRVTTQLVPVRVYTNNFEITGNAHAKPGGYSGRVSDILNLGKLSFLPITNASYRRRFTHDPFATAACLIVNVKDIELVDLAETD